MLYVATAAAARRAKSLGLSKFGTIICTEAPDCTTHERYYHEYAAALGLTSVSKTRTSVVQPAYTAECLAARNAGVELLAG